MTYLRKISGAACVSLLTLSGCATMPDPAEVCSAEWIAPRAERAIDDIQQETRGAISNLRNVGDRLANGKKPSLLQMMTLNTSISNLVDEFQNGRGIRDLKTLARTCDDPKLVSDEVLDFMRDQGLSDNIIEFVQATSLYQDLLRVEPDTPS